VPVDRPFLQHAFPEFIAMTVIAMLAILLLLALLFVVPALLAVRDLRSGRADPGGE
jgi:hypothetical protein